MERFFLATAAGQLTTAGEQAGFTVDFMIELLNAVWSVHNRVHLMESGSSKPPVIVPQSSRWVI